MRDQIGQRWISYELSGHGPPLVLLHAFPFDRHMWTDTARAFSEHRMICIDARGFGDSSLDDSYAIADLADDVAGLLDLLDVRTATVAGLSMGGYTALAFANRHPHRLAGLVLADTKASPDTAEARKNRDTNIALVRAEGP